MTARSSRKRLGRVGSEIVEVEAWTIAGGAREVGVDLEALEVADHEQRRVLQGLAVVLSWRYAALQVLALALVLPGEAAPLPDVGEAVAAADLLGALLEGVPLAGRVGLVGRRARRACGTGR